METDPVSETLCSLVFRTPDDGQNKKNVAMFENGEFKHETKVDNVK
jgi:hypothetical protein